MTEGLSLRAKQSDLFYNRGDCFVAELLAMTVCAGESILSGLIDEITFWIPMVTVLFLIPLEDCLQN